MNVFGAPSDVIMYALVALLAVSLAAVALVYARNRILFEMGLRNIPRRRAQSTLIVLGLMLSTAIVAAALTTGDTVNYSITSETYDRLGHVDEIVQVRDNQKETSLKAEQITPAGLVPDQIVDEIYASLNASEDVDGIVPGLRFPVPARHEAEEIVVPEVVVVGLDARALAGFEQDIVHVTQATSALADLERDEAFVNESLARELELTLGDRIDLFSGRVPRTLTVAGIVRDRLLTGWTPGQASGVLVRLETAQVIFAGARPGQSSAANALSFVAISNTGGVRGGLSRTDDVAGPIERSFGGSLFEISRIKQERVERAEDAGANMARIFLVLGLFSIAAGMLLVFLIMVMLAAERRAEMGMSRAIGMSRMQLIETFIAEGMAYTVTSALVGALLGVIISAAMTRAMAYTFDRFDVGITFHVTWQSMVIAYCLGVVLTFATVALSAWRVSRLTIVSAVRDLPDPASRSTGAASAVAGGVLVAGGIAFTIAGIAWDEGVLFGAGLSLVIIGLAFVARSLGQPERPVFSVASVLVLVLWGLVAGETLRSVTGTLDSGIATFFVGGVLMVAAATVLVVYNAESLLGAVRGVGIVFARAVPAVRTATAYPLANKPRTGMTIAMLSLVVFALVMISTLSLNFRNLFLSDDSRGGWDIVVEENPNNPLLDANGNPRGPLGEALDRAFYDTLKIESVAQVLVGNPRTTQINQVINGEDTEPKSFLVTGADDVFLEQNTIGMQARAAGFDSDRAVWDAVRDDINNAVIDGSVVPGINYANVTESRFTLEGYESGTRSFTPFPMRIRDTARGNPRAVRIIGIMNRGPSETYAGMYLSARRFEEATPPLFARYYVRLTPGADAGEEARKMATALAQEGVEVDSIAEQVEEGQRLSAAFFYLVQGFMALGLGVGLAALGVIAFRTVVERRQQIGLMRAIGFSRANIALSFILESAFIAVLGIVNGTWLALLLANRILQSEQFSTAGFTEFHVPWLQIAIMAALVFLASVLTTIIPSRQASSIPIAEALRYE